MNQQHLTKLANALVEKREKRAALWDKLLRTGQLSENAIYRIWNSLTSPAKDKIWLLPPTKPNAVGHTTATRSSLVKALREGQGPAKPYAPMSDILERLAELKKSRGRMAPSSKLDKGLFKEKMQQGRGGPLGIPGLD